MDSPRVKREAQYQRLFKAATREQWAVVSRRLARGDLYFLLTRLLCRKDVARDWLFDRCHEVQADPDGRLDLWARDHYKSTLITYGLTIQDILNDPEVTVGIFSHTRPIAKAFLKQIMAELETNQALKDLFPDVLYQAPRRESPRWSEDGGIVVKRKTNPKEATVEAWGLVDGQPTGKHFRLMVYDDVVTRESVTTPEQIAKVTEAWALSRNLAASQGGMTRYIGTRYHFNDTYKTILDRGAAIPRLHPATHDGTPEGQSVFLTHKALATKRQEMGPYVFACQMLQNPAADSAQGFQLDWLRYWEPAGPRVDAGSPPWTTFNRYILVDPASEKKRGSDYTVMWVVGLGKDNNYYVIDGVRDRLNLTERAEWLFRLHERYKPLAVGYEKYGQQADIEHIQDRMGREQYRFGITPLGGQVPKTDRIRRLVPLFEQGRLFIPARLVFIDHERKTRDLTKEFINDEYLAFPVGTHDDMLDALARILDADLGATWPTQAGPTYYYEQQGPTPYDPMHHFTGAA